MADNLPGINTSVSPNEIRFQGNFFNTDSQLWVDEIKKKLIPFFVQIKNEPCLLIFSLEYISVQCLEGILGLMKDLQKDKRSFEVQWIVDPSNEEYINQMGELLRTSTPEIEVSIIRKSEIENSFESTD